MTIKELAHICGVAVSTASRAMNDRTGVSQETRARILEAAAQHGYVPNSSARSLKITSTRAISVIIQGEPSRLLINVLQLLEEEFAAAGFTTTLTHVPVRRAHAATVERIVREGKFGGVVFLGRYGDGEPAGSSELTRQLAEIDAPMIFCTTSDYSGTSYPHSSVSVDDYAGGLELTNHLTALGHRRIAFVGGDSEQGRGHAWALRLAGYRSALESKGISVDPGLVIAPSLPAQLYTVENGYESTRAWLSRGRVDATALIASCDAVAVGAARALHEAGIAVPADCSLMGFDGLDIGHYLVPRLATIAQPLSEIAAATARVLLATIDDPARPTEQVRIRGRFLPGESVTKPHPAAV
ncbi:LacI family DNA-binding transcriptional regulator [Brooklawnia cerclae]|uniref:LacI family transcriptional regulator n=1 Tax=Brooklawnia cerclae TaxID=349934 RepID=A0ABX0SAH6_9ACTN|nr:LacI family DNA-binding transcriptional regulator [Brooklawnia cerclae]NIH55407.1 LacI family transcriptional regulator [Brooklawnia cerclae]